MGVSSDDARRERTRDQGCVAKSKLRTREKDPPVTAWDCK